MIGVKFGKDDPDGKFFKGTDNFKKDTLDYHNGNKAHKRSQNMKWNLRTNKNSENKII